MQGDSFIQLKRSGLHHINSHLQHAIEDDIDQPSDLIDDSDDDDDFDDDVDSDVEDDSYDEDDCEKFPNNSSDGISIHLFALSEIV